MSINLLNPFIKFASGGSIPSIVTDDSYAWFDSNDASSIIKDGSNLVSSWANKSEDALGTKLNLLQGTASAKPIWTDDTLNSLPAMSFVGNKYMQTDDAKANIPSVSQPCVYFIVARTDGTTSERVLQDRGTGWGTDYNNSRQNIVKTGSWSVDGVDTGDSTDITSGNWFYMTCVFNGASGDLRFNGSSVDTFDSGIRKMSFGTLGAWSSADSAQTWKGWVAEYIMFDQSLSSAEITTVETYLADKWDL